MPERTPELLAPAGGPSALRAAVANGADAVYLGVELLNARRGAENFTLDTLAGACDFAHLHGVRVYLTANVVVLEHEMPRALSMVARAWNAGVDAVIVQDLGLLKVLRETLPDVRVHSSTQMNAHSSETVRFLAEAGVRRITLARELTVDEIAAITAAGAEVGVEVESFVHGALCVCYSGQCLLSSMVGGRSANRGTCAQPCRLTYELRDAAGALHATPGAHLLSPRDLAGIGVLPQLVASGVSALKIEGRMKAPEYVAAVTGVYRAALDRAAQDAADYVVTDGEMAVLREAFSRGFSEAYLIGERGNDMMSYNRPNNRGVPVGRIVAVEGERATIALDKALDAEDTIEVWTGRGRFAQPAGMLEQQGAAKAFAPVGSRATITLRDSASVGDRVFRVRNASLSSAAARTFSEDSDKLLIPLHIAVDVVTGEPLRITVRDDAGREASASGVAVEAARTKPITAEEVAEHVGRLGGTPYAAASWDIALAPGAGLGFSQLHKVRRDALAAYEDAVLAPWRSRTSLAAEPSEFPRRSRRSPATPRLVAAVSSVHVARACLAAGAAQVHVPATELRDIAPEDGVVPLLPRVCHDSEMNAATHIAATTGVAVAGTLGGLVSAIRAGAVVDAHWSLNAANPWAVARLAEVGARCVWLSPELSAEQIVSIARRADAEVGVAIAGRQELMVTEHCVLMAEGECSRKCASCARRARRSVLKDRRGYEFPVFTDETGRTHLYNSVPLDITHALPELLEAGVTAFRIDLETEDVREAAAQVERVSRALSAARSGVQPERVPDTTTGHHFRPLE